MTGKAVVEQSEELIRVTPDQIIDDPVTNVRPWSAADDDQEGLQALAESLKLGQVNPITLRPAGVEDRFFIVTGRKRVAAARLIGGGFELVARVRQMNDNEAFHEAVTENAQRKDASAMDNAQNIATVRAKYGLEGGKNTRKVADWFGKSPAWVTTHEKLLKLSDTDKQRVQSQGWTAQAAIDLVAQEHLEAGDVSAVADRAEQLAEEEAGKKGKKKKVKSKHVRQALREKGKGKAKASRGRAEIVGLFSVLDLNQYVGAAKEFLVAFGKFCAGKLDAEKTIETFNRAVGAVGAVSKAVSKKSAAKAAPAKKKAAKAQSSGKSKPKK